MIIDHLNHYGIVEPKNRGGKKKKKKNPINTNSIWSWWHFETKLNWTITVLYSNDITITVLYSNDITITVLYSNNITITVLYSNNITITVLYSNNSTLMYYFYRCDVFCLCVPEHENQASRFSASGRRVPWAPANAKAYRLCQPMHVLSFGEGRQKSVCLLFFWFSTLLRGL